MKTILVPAITLTSLAVPAIILLLLLIFIQEFRRRLALRPSKAQILKSLHEEIPILQEKLTSLITRYSWDDAEQEIHSRHRGLALTNLGLLFTIPICRQMLCALREAFDFYPPTLRVEVGNTEASANQLRLTGTKQKLAARRSLSAGQTAKPISPVDWK